MLIKSFGFALKGIKLAIKEERNFRIMLITFIVVVFLGFYFRLEKVDWMMILLTSGIVLVAELFNTTIENMMDMISPDYHVMTERIKDLSAGSVLVTAIFSVIIGLIVFIPYLKQ
ncbi:MAG: diacylglycerol kinase family protein [Bacillota bacterium]|nr:diacylglycerol kinase family protein [Bacillota bacterium]